METAAAVREVRLWQALAPILVLIVLLVAAVRLFGADASYGPNQIGLLVATAVALAIGRANGIAWPALQEAVTRGVATATGAIFILLLVGSLIGIWILCGTVPALIHYGLMLLSPDWFYAAACLVCALVGTAVGSSWTVAGTIGVALMGVAGALGLNPAIAAGAIVSGAYFGDKLSPLSDTTNLAPAVSGSELFEHIRQMLWTTIPSFVLALAGFTVLGLSGAPADGDGLLGDVDARLAQQFSLGLHLLIPFLLVLYLAWRRVPALVSLGAGIVAGIVFALAFQGQAVARLGAALEAPRWAQMAGGVWISLFQGYAADTGSKVLDELLSRGGMASMLNTVWLIVCAMAFGAAMERAGLLQFLLLALMRRVRRAGSLVASTVASAFGLNVLTSDQYLSIVLSGRLYRQAYLERGLHPVNLSRAVEDGGTITSPLVPWNTCGAYMAATLGVGTLAYAPFALFNWINPLLAIGVALAGWRLIPAAAPAAGTPPAAAAGSATR